MQNILSGSPLGPNFWSELNQSLGSFISDHIRNAEDRVCMINGETEQKLRLFELLQKSSNLATHLQILGCKPGINVAIYSENSIEFMIAQLAIILSGATLATFNHMYTTDELQPLVALVRPIILFCSLQNYSKAKQTQRNYPFIQHLVILNDSEPPEANTLVLSNLVQQSSRQLIQHAYNPDATAAVLFSSGTTGQPKGVMLTNRNVLYTLHIMKVDDLFHFEGRYILCTVPMFHAFGMFVNLFTVTLGLTLVFLSRYKEDLYFSLIEKYKVQSLLVVPPMVISFLKSSIIKQYNLSSLKHILCGAASLKINVETEIAHRLNLERVQQGFGMTEGTFALTLKRRRSQKPGTCGSVMPGYSAKVVDPQTNEILGPGKVGELCFKGPGVMKGYLDNPDATADTIREEWLHTGDLGYYDEDGDFYVVDRLKELIKYNAFQVAPAELEDILMRHPQVEDAGVVGIPNEMVGELPTAFVVRQLGSKISEKQLQEYVASNVSPQKRLRGGVTFVNEIPKNPSGKILRKILKEQAVKQIPCKY